MAEPTCIWTEAGKPIATCDGTKAFRRTSALAEQILFFNALEIELHYYPVQFYECSMRIGLQSGFGLGRDGASRLEE